MFKTYMLAPTVFCTEPYRKLKYIKWIKLYTQVNEVQVEGNNGTYLVFEDMNYLKDDSVLKKIVKISNDFFAGRTDESNDNIYSVFKYLDEYHENGWRKQVYSKFCGEIKEYRC